MDDLKRRLRKDYHKQALVETVTENNQKQMGKTLWNIAGQLRGAMNADDFRDYMLAFLFLRYLSDNYEQAARLLPSPELS